MVHDSPSSFELHPRLASDCLVLGHGALCRLLLMNERRFPWCILVPEQMGSTEIFQMPEAQQQQLLRESASLGRALMAEFKGDKLNIAAIGNLVPQLHVHHIVRFRDDPAWPAVVWGRFTPEPYCGEALSAVKRRLREALSPSDWEWTAE